MLSTVLAPDPAAPFLGGRRRAAQVGQRWQRVARDQDRLGEYAVRSGPRFRRVDERPLGGCGDGYS